MIDYAGVTHFFFFLSLLELADAILFHVLGLRSKNHFQDLKTRGEKYIFLPKWNNRKEHQL